MRYHVSTTSSSSYSKQKNKKKSWIQSYNIYTELPAVSFFEHSQYIIIIIKNNHARFGSLAVSLKQCGRPTYNNNKIIVIVLKHRVSPSRAEQDQNAKTALYVLLYRYTARPENKSWPENKSRPEYNPIRVGIAFIYFGSVICVRPEDDRL